MLLTIPSMDRWGLYYACLQFSIFSKLRKAQCRSQESQPQYSKRLGRLSSIRSDGQRGKCGATAGQRGQSEKSDDRLELLTAGGDFCHNGTHSSGKGLILNDIHNAVHARLPRFAL